MPPPVVEKAAAQVRPAATTAAVAETAPGPRPSVRPDIASDAGSTDSSRPRVPQEIAGGRFHIRGRLGSGSYSDVYLGVDRQMGDEVAIKFEWSKAEKKGKVLIEARLCQDFPLRPPRAFTPAVRWFGTEGEYDIMVMDVLGPSLQDLLEECGGTFSLRTTLMLGIQMVDLLEYVHSCGILHRDIKPHNFLVGVGQCRDQVYIVDFGLSKRFRDPDTGEHIPFNDTRKGLTGTVRYTTRNVHEGIEPARRDDLGSVGYVMMQFLLGELPWQGIHAKSKKTKQRRIARRKQRVSHRELCDGFPDELPRFLEYCDALDYFHTPSYEHLRAMLRAVLEREVSACVSALVAAGAPPTMAEQTARTLDWMLPPNQRACPPRKRHKIPAEAQGQKKRRVALEGGPGSAGAARSGGPGSPSARTLPEGEDTEEYESYEYASEEYFEEEEEEEEEDEDDDEELDRSEPLDESQDDGDEAMHDPDPAAEDAGGACV